MADKTKGLLYMIKTAFYKAMYDDQNYSYDDIDLSYSGFADDIKKPLTYSIKSPKSVTKGLGYILQINPYCPLPTPYTSLPTRHCN